MAAPIFEPNSTSFAAVNLQAENRNLLRFTTAGSVDDGKSTLIGRLLYDSQAVYEDQLASVKKSRINRSSGPIDFSLLTDGLRAEREQGITIDVAYRYFSTPRRKFIIADTPGHEQYTRNMATGASTADAAIVLIDATKGVLQQSRRHAYIASLLGIRHVIVAVNKMDLVGYSREVFDTITQEFEQLSDKLGLIDVFAVPISALEGDNVVRRSSRTPWFEGPSLLEYLEELPNSGARHNGAIRFPVQYVIRPNHTFRGFAGTLTSGTLRVGDTITALPSGLKSRVKSVVTFDGEIGAAREGDAITITLEDEVDISRGDMLVTGTRPPAVSRRLQARVVWMHATPLDTHRLYILKHTTRSARARVTSIVHRVDINTFAHHDATKLEMNDIATVEVETTLPIFFDPYQSIPATGSFILIDPISNATVAAGMIDHGTDESTTQASAHERGTDVTQQERRERFGHPTAAVVLIDRPGAVKLLERTLFDDGWNAIIIDATDSSESELVTVAQTLQFAGIVGIFSLTSPEHRPVLSAIFHEAVFESPQVGSDADIARQLADQLRRYASLTKGKRSQ